MSTLATETDPPLRLRSQDRVRLRSLEQIVATLDGEGRTDGLPFMRELLDLQGRTLIVDSRADKTCDTVNGVGCTRQMTDTVHIAGARCDGSAHGGCQAYCLLFFKEQWLERVPSGADETSPTSGDRSAEDGLRERLDAYAHAGPNTYRCQATQLLDASTELVGRGHYFNDLRTRNVPLRRFARAMLSVVINRYQKYSLHLPMRLRIRGGHRLPDLRGTVQDGNWPALEPLNLQPGELVEVRSRDEIRATLDDSQRNRGLRFDEEMAGLCGRRGRVLFRVERLIDEKTGRMLSIKKDLYVISGMIGCLGVYHRLCTRKMIGMMREAWLRRVD